MTTIPNLNSRTIATYVLMDVLYYDLTLPDAIAERLNEAFPNNTVPDNVRSWVQEACFGCIRWYPRLLFFVNQLLQRPCKPEDEDLIVIMLLGIYQLSMMRIPPHAALSETVNVVRDIKKPWASGLVNAVLRNFMRQRDALEAAANCNAVAEAAHPAWLLTQLNDAWPDASAAIIAANNARPPMSLRVNLQQQTRDAYLAKLADAGLAATAQLHSAAGITLETATSVAALPDFASGSVFVQDEAAQLAASLLELAPGLRVLDACAAPGGKTTHILETEPKLAELVALDIDEQRLAKVTQNLTRLRLSSSATLITGSAAQPSKWWDNRLFDRILLDAPCSATGIIRRQPDIKLRRQKEDPATFALQQLHLLETVWPLLKPGGILVYATCSVLPIENVAVLCRFLERHTDAKEKIISAEWGITQTVGRQILPTEDGMDGFFYGRLEKQLC